MSPRVQTSTGGYLLQAGRAKPFRSAGGRLIVSSWWQPVRGLRALDWSRCEAFPDYVRDQYGHLDVLVNDIWTATSACSIRRLPLSFSASRAAGIYSRQEAPCSYSDSSL